MRLTALLLVIAAALVAGCGGGDDDDRGGVVTVTTEAPGLGEQAEEREETELAFPAVATVNTTRFGGDPVINAAAVALATYPSGTEDARPDVVTIVDVDDFAASISAGQLMNRPLRSPVLYSEDGDLPDPSADALEALEPLGAEEAADAQVLRVGNDAAKPDGFKVADVLGGDPASVGRAVDRIASSAAGRPSRDVIVTSADDPEFAMPAAALSAKTGAPVLWVDGDRVPPPTLAAIRERRSPRIYVVGPEEVVSQEALERLRRLGEAERISGPDPVRNAIAVARYADGTFGWNVVDPGHGLVFASAERPEDAAAAVALSGAGKYGPLLLLSESDRVDEPLQSYLLSIQPGFDADPVRGVYNHGWLMGGEDAISVAVQSRLNTVLEIRPVSGGE